MTEDELNDLRQFHAEIEEYERNNPLDTPQQAAIDAEDLRLAEQFPGEYVAYTDTWDGTTLTRTVLAHGPDYRDIKSVLDGLTESELDDVVVPYIDLPNQSLCTRALTGEIRFRQDAPRGE